MKNLTHLLLAISALWLFASCEHQMTSETTVHADGSLDKKYVFQNRDSASNIVGLSTGQGWRKTVSVVDTASKVNSGRYITSYEKSFASVDDANHELAGTTDTLLRITSVFEKRFRWFYTYLRYSETIHAVNWLRMKPDDYLVPEDYAFIERLPAEGKPISKADSYYLGELNKRMYDDYGMRAIFEEYIDLSVQLLSDHRVDGKWLDTLRAHKDGLFAKMKSEEIDMKDFIHIMDSIGVPLDTAVMAADFRPRNRLLEKKIGFISTASEGKYKFIVHLPWTVIETNADSVSGNTVVWSPPPIKFLVKDYTMQSESRNPNYIIWLLSGAIIVSTLYLLFRSQFAKSRNL